MQKPENSGRFLMENLKTSRKRDFPKKASSCKFPESCRSAIHPWDIETDSKFYASVTTITDGHKTKKTTAYAAANTRDDKSTNYGGCSITNFNTALLPQNPLKKHQEGKQVAKENRPITTIIRVRKLKFFMKEKNRNSTLGIYRTEAKRRKGSKSPDAVVSRGDTDRQRTVLGAKVALGCAFKP
jgi:hypothetical protein